MKIFLIGGVQKVERGKSEKMVLQGCTELFNYFIPSVAIARNKIDIEVDFKIK